MSQRHRQSREELPGYAKVPKDSRRLDNRRERQATRSMLLVADPDEVLAPPHLRATSDRRPSEATAPTPSQARRRFRHWKAPFWKRRTAMRHQRNDALRGLNRED